MNGRIFKKVRTALLSLACLGMAAPVWAGSTFSKCISIEYKNVDRWGCLTSCGSHCKAHTICINTCTRKWTCSEHSSCKNDSCRTQCYKNCVLIYDRCCHVECGQYDVPKS